MSLEDPAQSDLKWPDAKATWRSRWPRHQKLYTMRANSRDAGSGACSGKQRRGWSATDEHWL